MNNYPEKKAGKNPYYKSVFNNKALSYSRKNKFIKKSYKDGRYSKNNEIRRFFRLYKYRLKKKPVKKTGFQQPPFRATRAGVEEDQKTIKEMGFYKFLRKTKREDLYRVQPTKVIFPPYFEWLVRRNDKIKETIPRAYTEKKRRRRWFRFKLKKKFRRHFKINKLKVRLQPEKDLIKRLLIRHEDSTCRLLTSMLIRKGKKEKANKITYFMLAKLKQKRRGLKCIWWRRSFSRQILKIKHYLAFKPLRLGSMRHKIPVFLPHIKGVALALRTLGQIARRKSAGTRMRESVYTEMAGSLLRKSDTYKKSLEIHKLGLENRPYLRYLRVKRKAK